VKVKGSKFCFKISVYQGLFPPNQTSTMRFTIDFQRMQCLQMIYKYHTLDGRTIKTKDKSVRWEVKRFTSGFSGELLWRARMISGRNTRDNSLVRGGNHWVVIDEWNQADIQQAYEKYLSNLVLV
jgi:hypothetical protein